MTKDGLIGLIDATFGYYRALGESWHKDPAGVEAIREVRDGMVVDAEAFGSDPTREELAELCREWRAGRIELGGRPSYPPDLFIEAVCRTVEVS